MPSSRDHTRPRGIAVKAISIRPTSLLVYLACAAFLAVGCSSAHDDTSRPATALEDGTGPSVDHSGAVDTTNDAHTVARAAGSGRIPVGEVGLVPVATLDVPVAMATRSGTDDLYVAEQTGRIRRLMAAGGHNGGFTVDDDPVLDLSRITEASGERGLLGLVFSPDGTKLYVDYTDRDGDTHVVEYPMDGNNADRTGARELLTVDQPYANHNGGQLAFGPDGMLYIGLGDGGSGGDPGDRAQDTSELLGKILRIDPARRTGGLPYAIPDGNPFARGGGRPEIWIYGVRNPWRFSFDVASSLGDLWIGDVGQDSREEIDLLRAGPSGAGGGSNLGWSAFEGTSPFNPDGASATSTDDMTPPLYEYPHDSGRCAVVGGYVYAGSAIPALAGIYVFGDYCSARITGLRIGDNGDVEVADLGVAVAENSLSSFGVDTHGELYVLSSTGSLYRVTASGADGGTEPDA